MPFNSPKQLFSSVMHYWQHAEAKSKLFISGLALVILLIVTFMPSKTDGSIATEQDRYRVAKQSFTIDVLSRGTVKPARVIPIKSALEGNKSKLIWMVDEGKSVQAGEVIAKFDPTPFNESKEQAEQQFVDAEASLLAAKKALSIQIEEEKKRTENAAKQLEVAKLQADDQLKGSGVLKRQRLVLEYEQAKRSLGIAYEELLDYQLLLEKGHVSKREFEKAKDAHLQLEEMLNLKQQEVNNFDAYEWPKLKREAEITQETAEADYRRALRLSELEVQKRQDNVVKAQRDVNRYAKKLTELEQSLRDCAVLAPIDGRVFYQSLPRPEGIRKIQVGDTIWAGQTFLEIPDTQQLVLKTAVREFDVNDIKVGQEVTVVLDAFVDENLSGTVAKIDRVVAEDGQGGINRFSVVIELASGLDGVHVGMSGQATIHVGQVQQTLSIPSEFVKKTDDTYWVWQIEDGERVKKTIQPSFKNNFWVAVEAGLLEGDEIAL